MSCFSDKLGLFLSKEELVDEEVSCFPDEEKGCFPDELVDETEFCLRCKALFF